MLLKLNEENLKRIKNPAFRQYAGIYHNIFLNFIEQIETSGISLAENQEEELSEKLKILKAKGAIFRNNEKSIYINNISPACEGCQKGVGSSTYFISLNCHRNCYYCFNPNQENYEYFRTHKRNVAEELNEAAKKGGKIRYLALTGGEPLLHREDTVNFFKLAKLNSPQTHTRLYTSGDLLDTTTLNELQAAGLDEIRFSVKLEDSLEKRAHVLALIEEAKGFIPQVMVEMPVIPQTLTEMKELLMELDRIGIFGINLLEFCFPFSNVEIFKEKALNVKNPPHQILYNYWYAGGLPVSQSELNILELMEFAIDKSLKIGVHYCSLENKHTGQIYQQNNGQRVSSIMYFSPKDYFFKSAKVFGEDIPKVEKLFKKKKLTAYQLNSDYSYLEFPLSQIKLLKNLDVEVGVSSYIMEDRGDGRYLRELKVDLTVPQEFDMGDV